LLGQGLTRWSVPGHDGGDLLPGLVNVQKAIEHGHRNSEFSHEKWDNFPVRDVNVYQRVIWKGKIASLMDFYGGFSRYDMMFMVAILDRQRVSPGLNIFATKQNALL
jgi:hypothetical protein